MSEPVLLLSLSGLPFIEDAIRTNILSKRWRSIDLDIFRLRCSNYYGMSLIGRWIHIAVMKNIKELDLICTPKEEEDVKMHHCLATSGSLKVLRLNLDGCGLILPNFMGFPALGVLDLTCVDLLKD
ncbi:unnamed protein product [Lactuca saligna]|uniref:Uncharacterized protein n=1 Tax=Lactuca saligna TaxID=75948 RepID=A0AA35Z4C6_LACSI|nr:unnamed protein product [Lactuca saligna]